MTKTYQITAIGNAAIVSQRPPRRIEGAMTGAVAERAAFCRRRAEELWHSGRHQEALGFARLAFDLQPRDEETVRFCAWLFSNGQDHAAAGAAYERLLALSPEWIEGHRHASGSFAMIGELERAIFHARQASDRDPLSDEFARHAGGLLEQAGRPAEAAFYLARAAALSPGDGALLRRLSAALWAAGARDKAVALAWQAWRCDSEDRESAHHAAELLLRCGRCEEATLLLGETIRAHPADHAALRKLSAAEMLRADRAAAAEAYGRAAALDPSNGSLRRAQLAAYCDAGRLDEALSLGGELIRAAPGNREYAEALRHALDRRLGAAEADRGALYAGLLRLPRRPRPPRTAGTALATQLRVLHALLIRETRTRFSEARIGYGWALLEPVLHILMLSLVFAVMMHGRPPIGRHFFIFYYTGIIPYHLFVHTSSSMSHAIASNGPLLQVPPVSTFDVVLARGLLELATDLVVAVILLAGFTAVGLHAIPRDLGAVAAAFWKGWDKIWAQITRVLYFCSGIFYVPATMPDRVRHLLAWNPVLQAVDWFRASFFQGYDPYWLDRSYLVIAGLWVLLIGLALERRLRRRLYEPL